jgi:AhpD family alkylhydroperoxidase
MRRAGLALVVGGVAGCQPVSSHEAWAREGGHTEIAEALHVHGRAV